MLGVNILCFNSQIIYNDKCFNNETGWFIHERCSHNEKNQCSLYPLHVRIYYEIHNFHLLTSTICTILRVFYSIPMTSYNFKVGKSRVSFNDPMVNSFLKSLCPNCHTFSSFNKRHCMNCKCKSKNLSILLHLSLWDWDLYTISKIRTMNENNEESISPLYFATRHTFKVHDSSSSY